MQMDTGYNRRKLNFNKPICLFITYSLITEGVNTFYKHIINGILKCGS